MTSDKGHETDSGPHLPSPGDDAMKRLQTAANRRMATTVQPDRQKAGRNERKGVGPKKHPDPPKRKQGGGGARHFQNSPGGGNYPLPQDVTQGLNWQDCTNFWLAVHRYMPNDLNTSEQKETYWRTLDRYLPSVNLTRLVSERRASLKKALQDFMGVECVKMFSGVTSSRLLIGSGEKTRLETGIMLDRFTGVPYLPGSSVKGVCRAWKFGTIAEALNVPRLGSDQIAAWKKKMGEKAPTPRETLYRLVESASDGQAKGEWDNHREQRWARLKEDVMEFYKLLFGGDAPASPDAREWASIINDESLEIGDYMQAFGRQETGGEVTFFDSWPTATNNGKLLERDILNPHYPDYYQDSSKTPGDWQSPNPIIFLAVPQGVTFEFLFACHDGKLLKKISDWISIALEENGIGAKTAVGYGRIQRPESSTGGHP